jgi:hypothetical protein
MNRRNALRKTAVLAGSAAVAPSLLAILSSCTQTSRMEWVPQFLTEDQAEFVSAFVDTLLPRTETPGGLDVKTDIFLDAVFANTYNIKQQAAISEEINTFNNNCKATHGKVFADLSTSQKEEVFKNAEANSAKFNGSVWGTGVGDQEPVSFYRRLKSMALWGYFSSEEIGKNYLSYDPIPGEYRGCMPIDEVGYTWSL